MRWFLSFVVLWLTALQAEAVCTTGSMPFIFSNNTVADATQVNANFAQIQTGVGTTCAASGANVDITSLSGLTTPLAPSSGGTTSFVATAPSTGTNAIAIGGTNPPFVLTAGNRVHFIAGGTNTTAATVTVSPAAVQNLFRRTQSGVRSTQGGEIIAGNAYTLFYDGTEFVIANDFILVGEMKDFAGPAAPPGWLIADGSSISQTTFAGLFAIIGTTYGGGAGNFNLPDSRGRVLTGLDNYGTAAGAANRLTNAATGCGTAFTTLGVTCANASQSHTQAVVELAQHNHTDSGHSHTFPGSLSVPAFAGGSSWTSAVGATMTAISNTASGTANIQNTGSSQPMPIVNPNLGMTKIIRF